jgi:hypothetical protein
VRADSGARLEGCPAVRQWYGGARKRGNTGLFATALESSVLARTRSRSASMADQADVRRIALSLPEAVEGSDRFAFSVMNRGKAKGFAWVWMERLEPKKPRVANPDVLAVRVANSEEKEALLALDSAKFFTEPHYNGFPAVLVRLAAVEEGELEDLLFEAWRCQAPKALVRAHQTSAALDSPRIQSR